MGRQSLVRPYRLLISPSRIEVLSQTLPMTLSISCRRIWFAILLLLGLAPLPAMAQAIAEIGALVREERPVQTSELTHRRLTTILELYEMDEIEEALMQLESLETQRLSAYGASLVQQTFGFCYLQQGDVARAIEAFERTLSLDGLPNVSQQEMLYSLAALYATEGEFERTIATLSTWYAYAQEPVDADKFMLTGSSYAQLSEFANALPYIEEAIRRSEEPNESWYTLELSIHFELMDYSSAVGHLREMVVLWPDNASYWEMLASAHLELEDDANALATLMVAYEHGLVEEESKLVNLARLNLFLNVPYQAGQILAVGFAEGSITETQANLELLLSAWTSAREFERSIGVIDRLAPLTDDGAYYMQKAQLLNEQGRWNDVIEAADRALEMGGLDDVGSTLVLKGIAQAELGLYADARATFGEASALDTAAARNAEAWIEYISDR
jgi:tetratricopeptide (TPR) repeat protein